MLDFAEANKKYGLKWIYGHMSPIQQRWLYDRATMLPKDATAVEIGILHGRTTCTIMAGIAESGNGANLVCVEWFGNKKDRALKSARGPWDWNLRMRKLAEPLLFIGNSSDPKLVAKMLDGSLAWMFIDGGHKTHVLTADIRAWHPKLKPGGLMSGHDWQMENVRAAVKACYEKAANPVGGIWTIPKGARLLP